MQQPPSDQPAPSEPPVYKNPQRFIMVAVCGLMAVLLLLGAAIAGSYWLSISSVNSDRAARQQARVPVCRLAEALISKEHGQQYRTDYALYRATGCPAVLKQADRSSS